MTRERRQSRMKRKRRDYEEENGQCYKQENVHNNMDDGRVDDDQDIAYQKQLIVEHNIWLNENSQL